jgi:hypothetical protein
MFTRLTNTCKELGPVDTLVHACNRILTIFFRGRATIYKYYITKQPVKSPSLMPEGKGKEIEVREIERDDPLCLQFDRPAAVIQARFNQGGHCYAAFRRGELAGYLWLNFGKYQEDEARCTFILTPMDKSAWDYDVYIFPKHRLSFTFPKLWEYANQAMAERGIEQTYSRISYYNIGSLGSHKKLGSHIIGSIYFLQFLQVQLSFSMNFKPAITFSNHSETVPEIRVT